MARFFKPQIINKKAQAIGNKITEGHGMIPDDNKNKVNIVSQSLPQSVSKLTENQTKYLKILKPKQYIVFD
jgi:hypothetical protein